jgi:Outer membrane lipoprotein-sorting protein
MILRLITILLGVSCLAFSVNAADTEPPARSAGDLAASLAALQEGVSYVRLRLETKQPADTIKTALQIQIKQRQAGGTTDVVYQVLWPKERKGEAVLLRSAGGRPPAGSLFTPPDSVRSLGSSQLSEPLFGSDLSYQDIAENFFAWKNQAIAGNESVNGVNCIILDSRPGKGDASTYGRVRAWIDPRRLVPLRVDKYLTSGQLARRIDTTRVANDDKGRPIPANLAVRRPGQDSVTELDGSRIKHDVSYADRDFTPEGVKEVSVPRSAPE